MRVVAGPTDDLISVETTDGLGRRSLFGAVNNRLAPLLDDALVAGLPSGSAGAVLDDSFSGCGGLKGSGSAVSVRISTSSGSSSLSPRYDLSGKSGNSGVSMGTALEDDDGICEPKFGLFGKEF